MLTIILAAVVVLLAALFVAAARKPSTFHIERSVTIEAPPSAIFPHVNAARAWEAWSPWIALDPQANYSYAGPAAGVGSITRFSGRKCGTGTVTVVESRPRELIRSRLEMTKPFRASNDVAFTFNAEGDSTVVTWSMSGPCNFAAKLMRVFINCEEMCGRSFSDGLNNLKRLVEGSTVAATR
jgi:hypothetical protein